MAIKWDGYKILDQDTDYSPDMKNEHSQVDLGFCHS